MFPVISMSCVLFVCSRDFFKGEASVLSDPAGHSSRIFKTFLGDVLNQKAGIKLYRCGLVVLDDENIIDTP